MRAVLDVVPHFVWTCNELGACDYLNRRWVEYTEIESLHPDDRASAGAAWSQANVSGTPTKSTTGCVRATLGSPTKSAPST